MKTRNNLLCLMLCMFPFVIFSQPSVHYFQKISETEGNFTSTLDNNDDFGRAVACIGDLDNDGVNDIVVGAHRDDDGGNDKGALYVLFLNNDGTVKSHQKISEIYGGLNTTLWLEGVFGCEVDTVGDIDSDGVVDLVVGNAYDDEGGPWHGAVYILFMNTDGTVKNHQKISDYQGGFNATFNGSIVFGCSVAALGDYDGDNIPDILVGARRDNDGGTQRGAVFIINLNTNGTVKSYHKISDTQGNFTGTLGNEDHLGSSVVSLGDIDGDNISDIAVGAFLDDDGGSDRGAVWILFLNSNGTVKAYQKISSTQGGFNGKLDNNDRWGASCNSMGDFNNDGVTDLMVGSSFDDDGGTDRGAVWLIYLNSNGTVNDIFKISDTQGNFNGLLDNGDNFGYNISLIGDLNDGGVNDILVGAPLDDDGGSDKGAAYILFMDDSVTIGPQTVTGIITYDNDFSTPLANVMVSLLDTNNQVIDTTFTDANGEYAFLNVMPGTYSLYSSYNYPWGGGNATDAMLILHHFVGIQYLYGLRKLAGDCDASGYVNSIDALYVAQRFVLMINSFPAGDWVFETPVVIVDGNGTVIQDYMGLCVGDTNGSYIP